MFVIVYCVTKSNKKYKKRGKNEAPEKRENIDRQKGVKTGAIWARGIQNLRAYQSEKYISTTHLIGDLVELSRGLPTPQLIPSMGFLWSQP